MDAPLRYASGQVRPALASGSLLRRHKLSNCGRLQGRGPLRRPIKFMITTTRKMMRNT